MLYAIPQLSPEERIHRAKQAILAAKAQLDSARRSGSFTRIKTAKLAWHNALSLMQDALLRAAVLH